MNGYNLFAEYPDCVVDRHKLRGVLLDFFPGERLKASLIMAAYDAGIVAMIKRADRLDEKVQLKMWETLVEEFGLREDNAAWAVSYWMNNYGVYVLRKTFDFVEMPSNTNKMPNARLEGSGNCDSNAEALSAAKAKIQEAQREAEVAKAELAKAKAEAEIAKKEADAVKTELAKVKTEVEAAQREAEAAKAEADALKKLNNTKQVPESKPTETKSEPISDRAKAPVCIDGAVSIATMEDDEKFPKERVVLYPDEYQVLGVTNFKATVYKDYESDGYAYFAIKGEYDGKTSNRLIIVPMIYNAANELIGASFKEVIKDKIRSHKTYSQSVKVPNNEFISRVEIRITRDPVFCD